MYMKTFLLIVDNVLRKDYPDLDLRFYVSRRSRYVHMGSDVPLSRIPNIKDILEKMENLWIMKKTDEKFNYCEPYFIASTMWKYDYIIFRKNYDCECLDADNINL